MRRTIATVAIALVWLLAQAAPASAHSVSGVGATDWHTTLVAISPAVPAVSVRVVETGSRLELTNHGPEVVVLGYDSEPYLRVGPAGVFENLRSPATYLNCSRTGCPVPSTIGDPLAAPVWKHISDGQTVRWHDHRIHWMGSQLPPDVRRAPGLQHVQDTWTVKVRQGETTITVTGLLTWEPGPSPAAWLLLALALLIAAAALARSGAWRTPLAALVALLTFNDIYHAVGIGLSWSGGLSTQLLHFVAGSYYSAIGWVLGLLAVRLLVRGVVDGLYASAFAGVSAAVFTGLLDITVLSRSNAPFAGPIWLDRLTVAVSLGLGLGVAGGSVLALRKMPRADDDPAADGADWLPPEPGAAPA